MLGPILETPTIRIPKLTQTLRNLYKKEKWQKELHQGESKNPNKAKTLANIRWELGGGK